ncbi:MAG: RagB/SusD family nutrient uptake outer membrane protein [Muribaculaceae bacterium]|nr:RagB/SusD family nutrient uptake outer membrane protein [Muribaculaceae bacterium]
MKKILYSILLLGATLSLTGCKDFLDPRNLSNPQDAETYFSGNPEDLRPVAYDAIRYIATEIQMLDQAADLFINPRAADDGTFSMFQVTPDNNDVANYYKNVDGGINKANAMIYYGGIKGDEDLVAEGRFLRVFGYYYMTQQFGAVPYVDWYIQDANRNYPRVPLDELYPILLEECTDLYNNSPLPAQDHNGSASKQAVAAIAAKIALAAAWDLDTDLVDAAKGTYTVKSTDNFRLAAQWAEKAINGIQLTMSFADKWAWWNEGNEEEIFSAQYDRNGYPGDKATGGHSLMNNYIAYFGNCVQSGLKGTGSGGTNVASAKSASLFEKGDTRFEGTFMTTMYNAPKDDGGNANWELGYMAWYNQPEDVQKTLPVALRFYAPETTMEEAEADIRQLVANGQAKSFATNTYGVNLPFAAIITGTEVTQWFFKADGSMPTATTVPYDEFYREAANNGTTVTKYDDPNCGAVTGSQDYRDIPLLHVSEMYLVAAEAYLLAGDEANSLKYINAVRKRAGAKELGSFGAYEAPYTTSLNFTFVPLDLVLDERARECYAERNRYFDLRRTRQLVRYNLEFSRFMKTVADMSNAQGEIKWYRPIPQAEIDNNTAISITDQNPGY